MLSQGQELDPYARSWYQMRFQLMFVRLKGNAFQDFFSDILSRCHPGDFVRTRPWGPTGDRKNDGYLPSERKLYQVYAPNDLAAAATVKKITDDFSESLPFWEEFFDTWVFVHNAIDGLGPEVLLCLLALDKENPKIKIEQMGYEALEAKALSLPHHQLEKILGFAPDARAISGVRSSHLHEVLDHLARAEGLADSDIKPVSIDKIHKNSLSEESKQYLRLGQRKSPLLKTIFESFPDPLTGEKIAQGFRNKYADLRMQRLSSDRTLSELILYAGGYSEHYKGGGIEAQRHEAAVAAILAFLFEQCDIFEDPTTKDEERP